MINKILFNKLNLNLIVIVLLIIVIIPLNLSRTDLFVYNLELFISLVSITLILSCGLMIFSCLITAISLKFSAYSTYSSIVGFLLLWVFIAGIFFPVTGEHDPFFNLGLSINKKYEIVLKAILIILFWFLLKKKDKKNYFLRFIYFFVLTNFVFLFLNIQNNYNKDYKNNLNEFGKKNLIVLSFDGISGHKMYEEIINNKNFNKNLKDFKFYKNTITGAPFTNPSINIEINGKLINRDSKNYYKNILNEKNLDSSVYASYSDFIFDKSKAIRKGELQNYNIYFKINRFFQSYGIGSVGRWATPFGVFLTESLFYNEVYKDFINLISRNGSNKKNPFDSIKTFEKVDLYEYDMIFDNITFNEDLNDVVRMYHFTFSHWPILVNENCEEVQSLDDEIVSFKQEELVLKCVSKKIVKFLKNLKTKKIYDNSMIIIKSDHGKPNYIERNYSQKISDIFKKKKYNKHYKNYPYNQKINNSFYWGFGRYKSFILIKDQNQTKDKIEISGKQVFLHDLSTTYCNFFFKLEECNHFDKNNLVKNENQFNKNNYDIYIPKYVNSSTHMEDLKKYLISNNLPLIDSLKLNEIILSD